MTLSRRPLETAATEFVHLRTLISIVAKDTRLVTKYVNLPSRLGIRVENRQNAARPHFRIKEQPPSSIGRNASSPRTLAMSL